MTLAGHVIRLLVRNPRRSVTTIVGTALAAGLVSAVLLFGVASETTLTRRALADVPVDEQVVLAPTSDAAAAQAMVTADPAVRDASPFTLVHFDSAELTAGGAATQTSSGVIVGIDPGYIAMTGWFTPVSGEVAPGGIAISRDLSSNLGATAGDTIAVHLAGGATVELKVTGIVETTGADLVLGPLDPTHRAAGANPPANVAVMSLADATKLVIPRVPAGATSSPDSSDTSGAGSSGGSSQAGGAVVPVFASEPAVRREVHLRIDHLLVPGDPVAAQAWLDSVRRRLDRQGAGAYQVVDDASAALEPVAGDLAWGQILFLFLSLPGVVVALWLERLAADATRDSTRRHAAWLRAHGAGPRTLLAVFVGSTAMATMCGTVAGFAVGGIVAWALFGGDLWAAGGALPILEVATLTIVGLTALGAILAAVLLRADLARELRATRGELTRTPRPAWDRFHVDALALVAGLVALFLIPTARPAITTEGNPTVSLAISAFVGPCLIWIGATLLLIRLAGWAARRAALASGLKRVGGITGELASASLATRTAATGPLVVVIALAVSFAISVLVFDATYVQQQRVDARLTLGADLKAVPLAAADSSSASALAGPGVAEVTPFVDRIVYVGPEAQDLLAIDPAALPRVAPLSDTFFSGVTADAAMAALRSQPDGILVSAETAKDYSIVPGDRVRIRVPDASGVLRQVDFRMIGIALEFPTAPKDAFLVANQAYVRAQSGNDRISFVLASASGDPSDAARRLAARLGSAWQVSDLTSTTARLANEVTAVDLARLILVDLAFAVVIATVGTALFLIAAFADRGRELATLAAIGAEPRQLLVAIATESGAIVIAALVAGIATGTLIGWTLVGILGGVFDPAPPGPAVPLVAIVGLVVLTFGSTAGTIALIGRRLATLDLVSPLRVR